MSLFSGVTNQEKLAGIVGLSSYLLMGKKIVDFVPKEAPNRDTPIFMGHGDADPLVKYDWGVRTAEALRNLNFKVDFRTYKCVDLFLGLVCADCHRGLAHSAEPSEIDDLEKFIEKALPPLGEGSSTDA